MAITTSSGGCDTLSRLYNAKTSEDIRALYDEWSLQYDKDLADQEYVAPVLVAQAVAEHGGNLQGECFDAGCGSGMSGAALKQAGANIIDGVDLSQGMLDVISLHDPTFSVTDDFKVARKTGIYRSLVVADLSTPIEKADSSYHVVTCVGTLTHGHVKASPALSEFVRITKGDGLVVATILDDIWESQGYKTEVERLRDEGLVQVLSTDSAPYRQAAGVTAKIIVLKKRG